MVRAIVGANWGDEGKGKITDMFASKADVVIRFQGGANAGHTIINDYGKFALHLLPSGICHPEITNIIGNGVALDIPKLVKEINDVTSKGVPQPKLLVSDRAQIMMPYHVLLDTYEEERLADKQFGSTKSGIAPFYSDKYAKIGFQVCDLFYPDELKEKLASVCEVKNLLLKYVYHKPLLDVDELFNTLMEYKDMIEPYVADTGAFIRQAIKDGKEVLFEGAQGTLLDLDMGTYPYVTSSHPVSGGCCIGSGVGPTAIDEIVGICKSYTTRVGKGPFPTELNDEIGETIRNKGGEFGTTTGRPRRTGWFDAVIVRHSVRVNGLDGLAINKLDTLSGIGTLKLCVGYEKPDGTILRDFPPALEDLASRFMKNLRDLTKTFLLASPSMNCRMPARSTSHAWKKFVSARL